jgi:hypothetical protein
MTVALAHEHFDHMPRAENIARSHFGHDGTVTVWEILTAIDGRPGEDHVNLLGPVDQPDIFVCTRAELPKFFTLG